MANDSDPSVSPSSSDPNAEVSFHVSSQVTHHIVMAAPRGSKAKVKDKKEIKMKEFTHTFHTTLACDLLLLTTVRKTLKLNSLFFFIYFCPREPKHDSKCSQTNHGNNISHTCKYSIVYTPVHTRPHSTIKYSKIYVT